jgi:hypothetical protein
MSDFMRKQQVWVILTGSGVAQEAEYHRGPAAALVGIYHGQSHAARVADEWATDNIPGFCDRKGNRWTQSGDGGARFVVIKRWTVG